MSDSQPVYGQTFKKKRSTSAGDSPGFDLKEQLLEKKIARLEGLGFNLRQCKRSEIEWFYFKVKTLITQEEDVAQLDFDQVEEKFEALRLANSQRRQ